jgi:hypothetical protein
MPVAGADIHVLGNEDADYRGAPGEVKPTRNKRLFLKDHLASTATGAVCAEVRNGLADSPGAAESCDRLGAR